MSIKFVDAAKMRCNTDERREKEKEAFRRLVKLAEKEMASPTNYMRIKVGMLSECVK